jgi:uncharacterized protein (TIGR02246 family)
MSSAALKQTAEDEIRDLMDRWTNAVRNHDLDTIMSYYAPDIVSYDAIVKLQFKGIDEYRKHWEYCMTLCSGPMIFEAHEVKVVADGNTAFAHFLSRCGGVDADGKEQAGWMRGTAGYRRTNGRWQIVHEHFSAPFDMESGKALLGLAP